MKSLRNTVVLVCIAAVVIGIAGWKLTRDYDAVRTRTIDNEKMAVATSVQAAARSLTLEDFATANRVHQDAVFSEFFRKIQSLEIVRVKVWNRDSVVMWSDLNEGIGQQFLDNHEVEEALEGEVELELEKEEKEEHVTERQFEALAEIYVPVLSAEGVVIGVLEVYKPARLIEDRINEEFRASLLSTALIAIIAILMAALGIRFLAKR